MGRGTSFLFRSRQRAQEPTPARARRISGGPQSRPGAIPGDRESLEDAASPNNCSSSWLRRLIADRRGMMLVELAIAVPFVAALALGAAEVGRYLLLNQKLESATAQLADIFTREETLSVAQLDGLFAAVGNIVTPFEFATRGVAIIAAVGIENEGDDPLVFWQASGAGGLAVASEIGAENGPATLPAGLTTRPEQTLVIAELYYDYEPILQGLIPGTRLRKTAFYRPRLGLLDSLG